MKDNVHQKDEYRSMVLRAMYERTNGATNEGVDEQNIVDFMVECNVLSEDTSALATRGISCQGWTARKGKTATGQKRRASSRGNAPANPLHVPARSWGRFMGTLAIRQDDVLYFARSLVWRHTVMSIKKDGVLELHEGERYIRFCIAIQEHRKAGFEFTQENVDMMAALFKVTAPRIAAPPTVGARVLG